MYRVRRTDRSGDSVASALLYGEKRRLRTEEIEPLLGLRLWGEGEADKLSSLRVDRVAATPSSEEDEGSDVSCGQYVRKRSRTVIERADPYIERFRRIPKRRSAS